MGILISFLVNGLGTNGVNIATAVIQVGTFMVKATIQANINYVILAIVILLPIKIFIFTRWMKKNNKRVGNDTS